MSGQHYCLRWNNYQSNMTSVFHQLLQNEAFVDVTLACNDLSLKAHKVVLSACSSYFQKLLLENPCKHPTIIMPQDICYADLKFIIEFVYKGEIDVSQTELQSLLRTADQLKIKGLCEPPDEKENSLTFSPHFLTAITSTNSIIHNNNNNKSNIATTPTKGNSSNCHSSSAKVKRNFKLHDNNNRKHQKSSKKLHLDESIPAATTNSPATTTNNNNINTTNNNNNNNLSKEQNIIAENDNSGGENCNDSDDKSNNNMSSTTVNEQNKKKHQQEQPSSPQEQQQQQKTEPEQIKPLNMSSHGIITTGQTIFSQFGVDTDDFPPEPPAPSAIPVGHVDMQDHSPTRTLLTNTIHRTDLSESNSKFCDIKKESPSNVDIKFETLRSYDQDSMLEMDSHMSGPDHSMDSHDDDHSMHTTMMVTPELMGLMPGVSNRLDLSSNEVPGLKNNGHAEHHAHRGHGGGPKTWTQEDMDMALDALRNHNMSLTKASATYGIPSTTLWQRAHRLGIDTPKKEGPTKSWTEENLNSALDALRTGTISANKASKAYGIPSSTLYKIARREGIRLAAPFNAAPTTWSPEDLEKALESIRSGQTSVQKASTEFGIPTGTLYGRCKREGIELSRSNPTPWSEDAMGEALEAVRLGHMSINQAAIHYNLPYSSLYGRFKRGIKYESDNIEVNSDSQSQIDSHSFGMDYANTHHHQIPYQNQTNS